MKSLKRALLLGILVWVVPFIIGIIFPPMRESWRALFESTMALTISAIIVVSTSIYFKHVKEAYLKEGFYIGAIWIITSILFDIPFYSYGPM